jgi:hypothetical protein
MDLGPLTLSLLPTTSGTAASLLGTLISQPAASSGNPITALADAVRNETKQVAATAQDAQVKRDLAAFRAAVAKAANPTALLKDPAARKVLLTANGLGDQSDYAALATKALTSDTSRDGSLAAKLSDTRWLPVAKTYDFANRGLDVLRNPKVLDSLSNAYAEITWRQKLDAATPGISNALTFREQAGTITSPLDILGNKVLREVVTTALNIPKEIAFQSLEAQQLAITRKLDVSQFKNQAFVEQFARRYLLVNSTSQATSMLA